MGRTQPTYRRVLDRLEREWRPYQAPLDRRGQAAWTTLWQRARAHASACTNAARARPMESALLSMTLEQERQLRALRRRVRRLEVTGPG